MILRLIREKVRFLNYLSPRSVRSKVCTTHRTKVVDILARVHAVRYHATWPATINNITINDIIALTCYDFLECYISYPHRKSANAVTWVIIDCRTSITVTTVMVQRGHIAVVGLGDRNPLAFATKNDRSLSIPRM